MPQEALASILKSLRADSLDQAPIADTAARIEELSAVELKKVKKTADAKKIVNWVQARYKAADSAQIPERRQWYKNLDMYQGRQFTQWSRTQSRMVEPPAPDYEPRLAINVIEPAVRTEMAKTGSKRPTATVSPASNDDEDIMAALAGQACWDAFYDQCRFQTRIFNPSNLFRTVCGNGFMKVYYDPNRIDEAATAAQRMLAQQEAQAQQSQAAMQNVSDMFPTPPSSGPVRGKIISEYVDPFHLFVSDLLELDIQQMDYVLHVYTKSAEKAKLQYKDFTPDGWHPDTVSASSIFDVSHLGVKGAANQNKDSVLIIEAWVKPGVTPLLPQGGLAIIAGDELVALANEGIPYKHGEFPFAHITGIESGRFYRKAIVESINNIQNEKNRTYAQIIKQKNLTSKPQFFYDEGSVDPQRITSKAGLYIPVRLGMTRPTAVPITPLPQYVLTLLDQLAGEMDDITGQHQVSRGQAPGANSSANIVAALQETDDNFLFTTFDSIESAVETIARQYLSLVVQYWDAPRMVGVVGRGHANDAKILTGADVEGGTDIRIEGGSALPTSKAARIATVTDWIKNGIISPEDGLEAMEMGTLGKVFDKIKLDEDAARRENLAMRDLDLAAVQAWNADQEAKMAAEQAQADQAAMAPEAFGGLTDPVMGLQAAPAAPAMPARQSGPTATTQPGAVAPSAPGELVGAAVPAPPVPEKEIFFPINWHDNDLVHMQQHRDHANSQAYLQYPAEIKKVFEDHYYAHLARSMNLQAQAAERQAAQAAQQAAELAQQAPTVQQTARIGSKDQYAGQQFSHK